MPDDPHTEGLVAVLTVAALIFAIGFVVGWVVS